MTDRELLDLAAKAAGYEILRMYSNGRSGAYVDPGPDKRGFRWNPFTHDGDRLRLISALKMNIDYAECSVSARYDFGRKLAQEWWGGDEGDEAHAVLRVAAEIGRSML